ncbi:arsinothricin resistance N-acetyltransferase ArsN1 family A [Neobacillus sp. Marseille-QA0830]
MNVLIRHAAPTDAKRIAEIYNQGILSGKSTFETDLRSVEDRQRWLEEHQTFPSVVAIVDDNVVGFSYASEYRSRPCYSGIGETSVYIDNAYQKKGIGKLLLYALIEDAKEKGYWKLVSRIFDFNHASRKLCESCGFREVGIYEKHGNLNGKWINCVIVEKMITENMN